jgi:glycogen operon protein
MMSSGVPMITGGDELYRTQFCNNNAYNLDSASNWLDWANTERYPAFHTFARRLMQFRRAHPALRRASYDEAITWHRADGSPATGAYMDDAGQQFLAFRVDAGTTGDTAASIYVAYNGGTAPAIAELPGSAAGYRWHRAGDTAAWMEAYDNFDPLGAEYAMEGAIYELAPRSLAVFLERQ